jgi:hypothetical protein
MDGSISDVLSSVNREPWRAAPGAARSSLSVLRSVWPLTYSALVETYFDRTQIGRTYDGNHNDAGYLLAGLRTLTERAGELYGQIPSREGALDRAAAGEVRYLHAHQRQARDMRAYLVRAWLNLLVERPERIWPERYRPR